MADEGFSRLFKFAMIVPLVVKSSTGFFDAMAEQVPLVKVYCQIAPGWVVMTVVALPLTVKPCWIFAIASCVASSARPVAAIWREKFFAAIFSTRELSRNETAMVESRAVMRRTKIKALPESTDAFERNGDNRTNE